MNISRKNRLFYVNKESKMQKIYMEEKQKFQDRPNVRSLEQRNKIMNRVGRSASNSSPDEKTKKKVSFGRGDQHAQRLYEHAKTQQ
jgi:hypothetical protein